uniref:guanylate cyclase n=1 Tax=Megaselia scalaris TaxID=36166 RepID=T1GUN1_MEGSC
MRNRVNIEAHSSQLRLPSLDIQVLIDLFPFTLVLDRNMTIVNAGEKVIETWIIHNPGKNPKSFIGSKITEHFRCRRPKETKFEWDVIIDMRAVLFELELIRTGRADESSRLQAAAMSAADVENYDEILMSEQLKNLSAGNLAENDNEND